MKKRKSFLSGVIFLGFGIYFLSQQFNFSLMQDLYTWPTLLIICGIGFLANGYIGKEYESIFPGVVLTGIGLHFHITNHLDVWPDHTGIFLLLIALGLLLSYVKTGSGLIQGILFLVGAILILFFDKLEDWVVSQGHNLTIVNNALPILFIASGLFLLISKRKK